MGWEKITELEELTSVPLSEMTNNTVTLNNKPVKLPGDWKALRLTLLCPYCRMNEEMVYFTPEDESKVYDRYGQIQANISEEVFVCEPCQVVFNAMRTEKASD